MKECRQEHDLMLIRNKPRQRHSNLVTQEGNRMNQRHLSISSCYSEITLDPASQDLPERIHYVLLTSHGEHRPKDGNRRNMTISTRSDPLTNGLDSLCEAIAFCLIGER